MSQYQKLLRQYAMRTNSTILVGLPLPSLSSSPCRHLLYRSSTRRGVLNSQSSYNGTMDYASTYYVPASSKLRILDSLAPSFSSSAVAHRLAWPMIFSRAPFLMSSSARSASVHSNSASKPISDPRSRSAYLRGGPIHIRVLTHSLRSDAAGVWCARVCWWRR